MEAFEDALQRSKGSSYPYYEDRKDDGRYDDAPPLPASRRDYSRPEEPPRRPWYRSSALVWVLVALIVLGLAAAGVYGFFSAKKPSKDVTAATAASLSSSSAVLSDTSLVMSRSRHSPSSAQAPPSASASASASATSDADVAVHSSAPIANRSFFGMAYEPAGMISGCNFTLDSVKSDMQTLATIAMNVRTYNSMCNQTSVVLRAISELKLNVKVAIGIDMTTGVQGTFAIDTTYFESELQAALDLIKQYGSEYIGWVVVGNEVVMKYLSQQQPAPTTQVTQLIGQVRQQLDALKVSSPILIATSEAPTGLVINNVPNTQLLEAVDTLFANIHPWWGGVPADQAASNFMTQWHTLLGQFPQQKSKFLVGETGWPATLPTGATFHQQGGSQAPASIAGLQEYLSGIVCQLNRLKVPLFWFEMYDEPDKAPEGDPTQGAEDHWGLYTSDGNLKPGLTLPDCPIVDLERLLITDERSERRRSMTIGASEDVEADQSRVDHVAVHDLPGSADEGSDGYVDASDIEKSLADQTLDDAASDTSFDAAALDDPLLFLSTIFPTRTKAQLEDLLIEQAGDIERTVDEVLSRDFIESHLAAPPAADASREAVTAPVHRKAKKRKAKASQTISLTDVLHRQSAAAREESDSEWSDLASTGNRWVSIDSTATYISELLSLPVGTVTSAYYKADSNWAAAVENLLDVLELQRPFKDIPGAESLLATATTQQMEPNSAKRLLCGTNGDVSAALDLAEWRAARGGARMHRVVPSGPGPGRTAVFLHGTPASPSLSRSSSTASDRPSGANKAGKPFEATRTECLAFAAEYAEKANEARRQAARHYKLADHAMRQAAGYWADQAREHDRKRRTWEMRAARLLVDDRQASVAQPGQLTSTVVDLHNLTVQQAVALAREKVNSWWASAPMPKPLHIVTGAGTHSAGGKSQLGPAVEGMLKREGWHYKRPGPAELVVTGILRRT